MKLGICYNCFNGVELLGYSINQIRELVDYITVIFQKKSYYGNDYLEEDLNHLNYLKKIGFIDNLYFYDNDINLKFYENETNIRNLGLEISKNNNCNYHLSLDVDEFYDFLEFKNAKEYIENNNIKASLLYIEEYYKLPFYQIYPSRKNIVTFIHSIDYFYKNNINFPYKIDITRRFDKENDLVLLNEIKMHHFSYIRNNIYSKINNNNNHKIKNNNFLKIFNKYKLGNIMHIPPDFLNRRTKLVKNIFDIEVDKNDSIKYYWKR